MGRVWKRRKYRCVTKRKHRKKWWDHMTKRERQQLREAKGRTKKIDKVAERYANIALGLADTMENNDLLLTNSRSKNKYRARKQLGYNFKKINHKFNLNLNASVINANGTSASSTPEHNNKSNADTDTDNNGSSSSTTVSNSSSNSHLRIIHNVINNRFNLLETKKKVKPFRVRRIVTKDWERVWCAFCNHPNPKTLTFCQLCDSNLTPLH